MPALFFYETIFQMGQKATTHIPKIGKSSRFSLTTLDRQAHNSCRLGSNLPAPACTVTRSRSPQVCAGHGYFYLQTNGFCMRTHDDLPQMRHAIPTSWSAYAWIMVIFSVIALCGWIAGQYMGR